MKIFFCAMIKIPQVHLLEKRVTKRRAPSTCGALLWFIATLQASLALIGLSHREAECLDLETHLCKWQCHCSWRKRTYAPGFSKIFAQYQYKDLLFPFRMCFCYFTKDKLLPLLLLIEDTWQLPNEGRVYFSSRLDGSVHHCAECKTAAWL